MRIVFYFDILEIFNSKIGRFAISYYNYKHYAKKKVKPKDNFGKIIFFLVNIAGEISILFLRLFTRIWINSLSKEELKKLG